MSKFKAKSELNINKSDSTALEPINKIETTNQNTGQRKSVIDNYIKEDEVIDMSKVSLINFSNLLQNAIDKRSPIFLWSKERQNTKIRLDNEYQLLILKKIRDFRLIADEYSRLKSEEIFTPEFIRNLVANKRMEAEHYFEKAIADHQVYMNTMKIEIDLKNSLVDHDFIEKDRKIAENERIRVQNEATRADNIIKYAQADKLKAEAESIRNKNELYGLVISKINFDNFPPVHLTYLISVLSGFNAEAFTDLDIKEKLKEVYINMEETKAKKAQVEVEDFMNSAEFRKWKNDQAKKDAGL